MAERIRPEDSIASSRFPGLVIGNVVLTGKILGTGSDAEVCEVDWNGTPCAAKRLHEILLEDESPGGPDKFIRNFEAECITWSKLRHPGVVQFVGIYLMPSSRLPVLVMEKMDTSLRRYCEDHNKEEFPLQLKALVFRQVSQALAYLHNETPPLVHHDLSPNNVLLNVVSFFAKLTDFGMSRAIKSSATSRKSSIKGTPAFMPPEALQIPLEYDEKLDVFSFGNIILYTITHEWPEPCTSPLIRGDRLIELEEFQRRENYISLFTAQEKQLLLPTVRQCLENRPDKRPSSAVLVRELRRIESSLSNGGHIAVSNDRLRQRLAAKEEECRKKDETLREKEEALKMKDTALGEKDEALKEKGAMLGVKEEALRAKDATLGEKEAALREKDAAVQEQQALNQAQLTEIQMQHDTIQAQQSEIDHLRKQLTVALQVKHPLRDWRKLGECQKIIQHSSDGGAYNAIAVNIEGLLAVTDAGNECIHLLTTYGTLVRSIGKGVLGVSSLGVAFDSKGNVLVTDWSKSEISKLSQDGRLLQTIHDADNNIHRFNNPIGVAVDPKGLTYICARSNNCVTVLDQLGKFCFSFGLQGSGPGCFDNPDDLAFDADGRLYVVDGKNKRICVWSKEGNFERDFETKHVPNYIAATNDNHLLITSTYSHTVMVYTLEGELIHEFGAKGSNPGRFNHPWGICVDGNGRVYVADMMNNRVQVF